LQRPWIVPTLSEERSPSYPKVAAPDERRSASSRAAFSAKVQSTISPGSALPDRRRFRVLKTSEKVLPDPDRP
jgi:hypothetical protein